MQRIFHTISFKQIQDFSLVFGKKFQHSFRFPSVHWFCDFTNNICDRYPKDVISCCPLGKLLFSLHKNHFYFVVRINRRFVECLLYIPGSILLCSYISPFNKINLAFICSWWLFHYLISFFR